MQINFVYDNSADNAPAGFKQALNAVAAIIDAAIVNPITINMQIGYGEDNGSALGAFVLGEAQPAFGVLLSYQNLVADLQNSATSATDAAVVAALPTTDPSQGVGFFVSVAQAIAWGEYPDTCTDIQGYAGFSSTLPFTYDPVNGIAPGTYDFQAVALHELTHALGRYLTPEWLTPMDLLTYDANGRLNTSFTTPHYLSFNGGVTNAVDLDATSDPADFSADTTQDPFNSSLTSGESASWTSFDSQVMDALGFQTSDMPPGSAANFAVLDTTTNLGMTSSGSVYTGPVSGIQSELIAITTDSLNITSNASNVFLRSGAGDDALNVEKVAGRNVLDGGSGSNFLVGSATASSQNTFFVDDRDTTAQTWSTVVNAHFGDDVTVWGVSPDNFAFTWLDGQGAALYQGLTLNATAAARPTASLTLTGYTIADLGNGRLAFNFGSVDGNTYLDIKING